MEVAFDSGQDGREAENETNRAFGPLERGVATMKRIITLTVACLILAASTVPALAMGDKAYYANHPTTSQELQALWGTPAKVVNHHDGTQIMVFDKHSSGFPYDNRYFVIQNGQVVDGGVNYNGYSD